MKYNKELYINSGIYGDEEECISCRKEKVVKCRTNHVCVNCDKEIYKGEQAVRESGFSIGEAVSRYTCLECIEKWLEENGKIEGETHIDSHISSDR